MEQTPLMKAMYGFAMADPDDCDREWAACLTLGSNHETASISSPMASTSSLQSRVGASTATATASASTSTRDSSLATKDDLNPEARRVYDYIVGNSDEYVPVAAITATSSASMVALTSPPASVLSATATKETDPSSVMPATCLTVCLGEIEDVQEAVDLAAADLTDSAPTTCSAECPSHDDDVSVSVLISSTTKTSSTTIDDVLSELAVPIVDDKALDVDATDYTSPTIAICLPGGSIHSISGEDPVHVTPWNVHTVLKVPPRNSPRPPVVSLIVPELCTWSPTCSTDCLCCGIKTSSRMLPDTYMEFSIGPNVSTMAPWPPPSCTCARPPLIRGQNLFQHAQQKYGKEFSVMDSKGNWIAIWLDVELKPPWPPLGVCMNLPIDVYMIHTMVSLATWPMECSNGIVASEKRNDTNCDIAQPVLISSEYVDLAIFATGNTILLLPWDPGLPLSGMDNKLRTIEHELVGLLTASEVNYLQGRLMHSQLSCSIVIDTILKGVVALVQLHSQSSWGLSVWILPLANSATYTSVNWCYLNCTPGSSDLAIPHWVFVNFDSTRVQFQWAPAVRKWISHHILLGNPDYYELTPWTFRHSHFHSECWFYPHGHILFSFCTLVQWKNHWTISLVSLQIWFQCSTQQCSRYNCENFQWTIAWVLSYHFPLSTLQTRLACDILLMQQNSPAIYEEPWFTATMDAMFSKLIDGLAVRLRRPSEVTCLQGNSIHELISCSIVVELIKNGRVALQELQPWTSWECVIFLQPKPPWPYLSSTISIGVVESLHIISVSLEFNQLGLSASDFMTLIRTVSKSLRNINISYELKLQRVAWCMFCARFRPPETYFLLVDLQHNYNKYMSSGNYPLPCVDHVQGALLGGYIMVGSSCLRSARDDELTQGHAADGVTATFAVNETLLLPRDPADYSSSAWRQSNTGRVDDACYCPGIDTSKYHGILVILHEFGLGQAEF